MVAVLSMQFALYWLHALWYIGTNILEELAASIFKFTLKLGAAVSLKIADTCLPNYMVLSVGSAMAT